MSTFYVFIALIIFFCFLLILVIMVQNPKGGGLSSSFHSNIAVAADSARGLEAACGVGNELETATVQ